MTTFLITAHYRDASWPAIQARYFGHFGPDRVVVSSVEGIPERALDGISDQVWPLGGSHAGKLNWMARRCLSEARDDDVLVFLDPDAFPVSDVSHLVRRASVHDCIVSVVRSENAGDPQPHPCFTAVAASTWRAHRMDWSDGPLWKDSAENLRTDVGAVMLEIVEEEGLEWIKLHRSNTRDLHPLFFGLYGGLIYHHGAGTRRPVSLADQTEAVPALLRNRQDRISRAGYVVWRSIRARRNRRLALFIRDVMERDPDFWRAFA